MLSDIRVALRVMRRTPVTSGLAVLTLALGVGAATATYMVVQGVVLRDLPYPDPDRLVLVWRGTAEDASQRGPLSPPDLIDLREGAVGFAGLAGVNSFSTSFLPEDGNAEQVQLGVVTAGFFRTVGVAPIVGRVFAPEEYRPIDSRDPDVVSVIVLSHDFWVRRFGGDPAVTGRTLRFGGGRMTVVGVMPEDFALHMPVGSGMSTDLIGWTPLGVDGATASRDGAYLKVWGRLSPGVTAAAAQAQLEALAPQLRAVHRPHEEAGFQLRLAPLQAEVIAHVRGVLLLLALVGAATLLVACANVAGLLLVQFTGRMQEVSVRAALGAGRGRIVRQLTTEAALLNVAGASLGLVLTAPGVVLLLRLDPGLIPKQWAITTDAGVLLFAAGMAVFATLLSGAIPAAMIGRAPLGYIVRSRVGATRGSQRVRAAAVAGQVACALLLIYGSVSLVQTLVRWQGSDFGFDPDGVHTFAVSLPFTDYGGPDTWIPFYDALQRRLAELPGIAVAAAGSDLPMAGDLSMEPYLPTELAASETWGARTALHRSVSPGYFEAAGIPVVEGRVYRTTDREGAAPVAVVDQEIARQLRRDRDGPVVGRRLDVTRHLFRGGYSVERTTVEVVGVVTTVPHDHPDAAPAGMIYLPHAQYPLWSMNLLVRGVDGRTPDAGVIRAAVAELDPRLPVFRARSLDDLVASRLAPIRFILALVGALTAVVTSLVAVGLFGMVAETVRQGRRDLGIRLALGATRAHVVRTVLSSGGILVATGLVLGASLTPAAGRLLATTTQARDAWSAAALAAASLIVLGVGFVSCYLPARRAGGIDPLRSLRDE